jgi:hypothetical protein
MNAAPQGDAGLPKHRLSERSESAPKRRRIKTSQLARRPRLVRSARFCSMKSTRT